MNKTTVAKNIIVLYGFSIAKILFPLITLPYLTRVLSVEKYGVVAYVKSIMTYMQLVIDFGFMLSGTKEIVQTKEDKRTMSAVVGDILLARLALCAISFAALYILSLAMPILRGNMAYTLMTFAPVALTVLLFDYVFRGLEQMQVITVRFIIMKSFSTVLTFLLVKSDSDLMLIPILDTIGSVLAIVLVWLSLNKLGVQVTFTGISSALRKLRESAIYFASNIATTIGGALSTLLIGAFMQPADIAYWGAALQLVSAVLALYSPVIDGVYPNIVKTRDYSVIRKTALIFMPLIALGCLFVFAFSDLIVTIAFGEKYAASAGILKGLIPVLFFAFPAQLLGWPSLGTIGKTKQVTISTVIYGTFTIVGLLLLIVLDTFTLKNVVILRSSSEIVLFFPRLLFCIKYRQEFSGSFRAECG